MKPAFSVVFFTVLSGLGQGAFIVPFISGWDFHGVSEGWIVYLRLLIWVSGGLTLTGLIFSFFHLGHPERAWRAAAMWRTSWLSREVIVLPIFLGGLLFTLLTTYKFPNQTSSAGLITVLFGLILYLCTAMIYVTIKFIQEWRSSLTVLNFTLMGLSSGAILSAFLASFSFQEIFHRTIFWGEVLTCIALLTRWLSLRRNRRIRPISTIQTAIGVKHSKIKLISQGFTGRSFNNKEFFSGASLVFMRNAKVTFMALTFFVPLFFVFFGGYFDSALLVGLAAVVQTVGLLVERWYFFADARHPQNHYYEALW
jgi:DMSO reductase anchor subunit